MNEPFRVPPSRSLYLSLLRWLSFCKRFLFRPRGVLKGGTGLGKEEGGRHLERLLHLSPPTFPKPGAPRARLKGSRLLPRTTNDSSGGEAMPFLWQRQTNKSIHSLAVEVAVACSVNDPPLHRMKRSSLLTSDANSAHYQVFRMRLKNMNCFVRSGPPNLNRPGGNESVSLQTLCRDLSASQNTSMADSVQTKTLKVGHRSVLHDHFDRIQ